MINLKNIAEESNLIPKDTGPIFGYLSEISTKQGLEDVMKGRTTSIEGIKVSKDLAQGIMSFINMSPYGRKFGKQIMKGRFASLIRPANAFGVERYLSPKAKKEFKTIFKNMKSSNEIKEEKKDILLGKKKGPAGADPKKTPGYFKGLSKKDKEERSRVIKRRTAMDDDDPDAYKPFRSDKGVKTKSSVHTNKFKKMFGEQKWNTLREVFRMSKGLNEMSAAVKKALKTKAEKSGMPFGVLKQVFNRGMAAWKTGHRPGASQQQWGYARVNSFATKSPGTWGKADKDLAKKVRDRKKKKK